MMQKKSVSFLQNLQVAIIVLPIKTARMLLASVMQVNPAPGPTITS